MPDDNNPKENAPARDGGPDLGGGPGTRAVIGGGPGRPLFTAYVYPFEPPDTDDLRGGPGTRAAIGGGPGRPLFTADIYPFSPPDGEN